MFEVIQAEAAICKFLVPNIIHNLKLLSNKEILLFLIFFSEALNFHFVMFIYIENFYEELYMKCEMKNHKLGRIPVNIYVKTE